MGTGRWYCAETSRTEVYKAELVFTSMLCSPFLFVHPHPQKQCAQISPSSFLMLEEGRARTFAQRNTPDVAMAVSACPVNCMHKMSFRELKEMEIARDADDWEDVDRRHLNHRRGNIPLHVAGMDSDANHRSSWYHYLKQKCHSTYGRPMFA